MICFSELKALKFSTCSESRKMVQMNQFQGGNREAVLENRRVVSVGEGGWDELGD